MRMLSIALLVALWALPALAGETWKTDMVWPSPAMRATGIAWDGRYLWHGESGGPGTLYKTDPKTGRVLSSVQTQMSDPGDIEWLNGAIWATEENRINGDHWVVKIDPRSGATLQKVKVVTPDNVSDGQCEAVATDGNLLYVSWHGRWIIKIDPATGETVDKMEVGWANPDLTGNAYYLDGLAWAFGHLFAVTNTPLAIVELDPRTGRKLAEFKAPAGEGWGPEGLATDGTSLYYAENTTNRYYRITLIDGYFR